MTRATSPSENGLLIRRKLSSFFILGTSAGVGGFEELIFVQQVVSVGVEADPPFPEVFGHFVLVSLAVRVGVHFVEEASGPFHGELPEPLLVFCEVDGVVTVCIEFCDPLPERFVGFVFADAIVVVLVGLGESLF